MDKKEIEELAFNAAKDAFTRASMNGGLWEQVKAAIKAYNSTKAEYERNL